MGHTAALSASVTVALCGLLTLGPAAVASPEARTAPPTRSTPSTPSTPSTSPTSPDSPTSSISPAAGKDREKLASTFRTATKFGKASEQTGELATLVLSGEKDEQKLTEAHQESDKELDNLLAIIPGGSPAATDGRAATAHSAALVDLKATVALIKADTKTMVDAAQKADAAGFTKASGTLMVHLGQLATSVFLETGLDAARDVLPNPPSLDPAQLPQLPGVAGPESAGR